MHHQLHHRMFVIFSCEISHKPLNHVSPIHPRDRPFRIILTSWRNFNIVFFLATVHRIRRDQQHYSFRMMNEAYSATGGGSGQSVPSKNSFQTRPIRANETNQVVSRAQFVKHQVPESDETSRIFGSDTNWAPAVEWKHSGRLYTLSVDPKFKVAIQKVKRR